MKLLKLGNEQILVEKQNGEKKKFKTSSAAIEYAKKNDFIGKEISAEWQKKGKNSIIVKISLYKPKSKGGYSGGNYNGNKGKSNYVQQEHMVERSVYASVATIVSQLEGVDKDNVASVVEDLFAQGLSLVKGTKTNEKTSEDKADDLDDDFDTETDDLDDLDDLEDDDDLE